MFKTIDYYLQEYRSRRDQYPPINCALLQFTDNTQHFLRLLYRIPNETEQIDIYNGTSPFTFEEKEYIAARVERREDEYSSKAVFFEKAGEAYRPIIGVAFDLQDPFISFIHDEVVFGGVEANPDGYKTIFYRGKDFHSLEKFAEGPHGMKDIRLVELDPTHKKTTIGVYTRPQGGEAERGQIGYTEIDSLDDLNAQVITDAPLLSHRFASGEWGGANEIFMLREGKRLVLAHIAKYDEDENRHYYPFAFVHENDTIHEVGILAERSDLPNYPPKRPDLEDVLFSGGARISENGEITLTVGIGDSTLGTITQKLPDNLQESS